MNALDRASAEAFQEARGRLQTGPWYTGQVGGKGYIVTEAVNGGDEDKGDGIKRYTDRYLRRRRIGRSAEDFPFDPRFLPAELYKVVGLKPAETPGTHSRLEKLPRVDRFTQLEDGEAIKKEDDNEENDEENEEEVEDEFEEVDDDDYNAEKYFDDGDEEGEADDGDNEAAY